MRLIDIEFPRPAPERSSGFGVLREVGVSELRVRGLVKFFNEAKGFGFIMCEGQPDVFLHASALPGVDIGEGDRVTFEIQETPRGVKAVAVRLEA
jgi:CspA family cold shock protein